MRSCPSCHEAVGTHDRFCPACGTRLPDGGSLTSERRLVTVVFADLVGSTQMTAALDPEAVRETARGWFARVRAEVEKHGGHVEKFAGDGVMAVFGVPNLHDDDAARAARAALDIVDATERYAAALPARLGEAMAVRVGLESGEVVIALGAGEQFIATGLAVNTAARLQGLAQRNSVLIGPNASRLLEGWADLGVRSSLELKGIDYPVDAAELVAVHSQRPDRPGRYSLPFAGRAGDLALLRAIAGQARSTRAPHIVALIGPAGIGKSRLAHQAVLGADALVLEGRCPSYGDASGMYPLAQIVSDLAGFVSRQPTQTELREALTAKLRSSSRADEVVDVLVRIDDVYGVTPPTLDDVIWAMREAITVLGRERFLVVIVEDIHWASERLIRVIARVANEIHDASVLVIFTARPEVTEGSASWVAASSNTHTINLAPLPDDDVRWLIEQAYPEVEPDNVDKVVRSAEGNPLFVNMLVQEQSAVLEGELPLGVVALANARLHQLPDDQRLLLGRAAVLGRVFYPRGVAFLGNVDVAVVQEQLADLQQRRFVHESPTDLVDEPALAFDHALTQEAAYRQLPKSTRIELHSAAADWLSQISLHPTTFQAIAHHRLEAVRLAEELGVEGSALRDLSEAAARASFEAAHSLDASNSVAAAEYLYTAFTMSDDLELRSLALFDVMLQSLQAVTEDVAFMLADQAAAAGRLDLYHLVRAGLLYHATGSLGTSWADLQHEASEALRLTSARGDVELVLRSLLSQAHGDQQLAPEAALQRVREAHRLVKPNDHLMLSYSAIQVLGIAANLDTTFEEVQGIVNEVFTPSSGFRLEHRAVSVLARFASFADRVDDVEVLVERHYDISPRLSEQDISTNIGFMLAPALALVEEHERALMLWDSTLDVFERYWGHDVLASVWPEMAFSLMALGRYDDAREFCDESRCTTADDDDFGLAQWHSARARLAAADGDGDKVRSHAEIALSWIEQMNLGGAPARLRVEVAEALRTIGDTERARVLALQSREDALQVGAFAIARRANAVLERVESSAT